MTILETILAPGGSPIYFSDNNLIQGKGTLNCSTLPVDQQANCTNDAPLAQFRFQSGKTHRLRLINSGSEAVQRFSIDEHTMTIIANDFVPVEPYDTKVVTLGVGQRTDVLVKADAGGPGSSFWMRSNITSCSQTYQPYARAIVYYEDANTDADPNSVAWNVPDPGTCANDALNLTHPMYPMALPEPSYTHNMTVSQFVNSSDVTLWEFDDVSFRADYNSPTLLLANLGNTSFPAEWAVKNIGMNTSVRIIVNNDTPAP